MRMVFLLASYRIERARNAFCSGPRNNAQKTWQKQKPPTTVDGLLFLVRLIGIEPTHPAPEAGALSTELQAHIQFLPPFFGCLISIADGRRNVKGEFCFLISIFCGRGSGRFPDFDGFVRRPRVF